MLCKQCGEDASNMPCDFVKRLRFWRGNFEEDREEDAHEFLIQLIYACPSEDILVVLRTNTINVQHVNVNLIMRCTLTMLVFL